MEPGKNRTQDTSVGGERSQHCAILIYSLFVINVDSFLFWVLVVLGFRSDIDWRKVVDDVKFSLGVENHACSSVSWHSLQ